MMIWKNNKPTILGLNRSFGFGDRLGLATPGHIAAVKGTSYLPIFAQQSIRELSRTNRQPEDVLQAACSAVKNSNWTEPWGADADHLQTQEDVLRMARTGFTFFTIDPSKYVNDTADDMDSETLTANFNHLVGTDINIDANLIDRYFEQSYEITGGMKISFDSKAMLLRAIVKYSAALAHTKKMYDCICEACKGQAYEVEMSVDETANPTTPLEHLFIGLELKRMGVTVVSLAPRFVGAFEKGIDYKGNIADFETQYRQHIAIARYCGPYKISIHSGSDKFSIYPIIGRLSGGLLHVKTAGTSYLEALRVVCLTDKKLFRKIVIFCRDRYETDKQSYHVSAGLSHVPTHIQDDSLEKWYLENESGRQILHVTFGSVLGGKYDVGRVLKDSILENLERNKPLYLEVLFNHLGKHIRLLLSED